MKYSIEMFIYKVKNRLLWLSSLIIQKVRSTYCLLKRLCIHDKNISIIANDCIGGIIYHDLKLKFQSPTINLFFDSSHDYIEYLSHIEYYSKKRPIEIHRDGIDYPIGEILNGNKSIIIHFMHYHSFAEAEAKWVERGKRINYKNIVVIWHVGNEVGPSNSDLKVFDSLDFSKKMLITGVKCNFTNKYICKLELYSDELYYPGKILEYKSRFSIFRYLDKTHYVRLLR